MNNNEINRKLKNQLNNLQDVPARDLQQSHIGKEKFLSEAKNIQPRRTPARTSKTRVGAPLRKSWVPRLATILTVVLFVEPTPRGRLLLLPGTGLRFHPASAEPSTPLRAACPMICFTR